MSRRQKPGTSLRKTYDMVELCRIRRDCYAIGPWSISTDGNKAWISKQTIGKPQEALIEIPKRIFDRLLDLYERHQPFIKRR
jgi:hypothetical protein